MFIATQDMKSHSDSPPGAERSRSTPSHVLRHKSTTSDSLMIHYAITQIVISLKQGQYVVFCVDHEGNFFEVTL